MSTRRLSTTVSFGAVLGYGLGVAALAANHAAALPNGADRIARLNGLLDQGADDGRP